MRKTFLAVFLLISLITVGQNQIRFERITVEDGLSQSSINSMVQDNYGYLWVGTSDGINKYDGNKFYQYHHIDNDSTSIPNNRIRKLFVDESQNVWISVDGYLSRYQREKNIFVNYSLNLKDEEGKPMEVNSFQQERAHLFLLGTLSGIWQFNTRNGQIERKSEFSLFDHENVRSIIFDRHKRTWVATESSVYLREKDEKSFELLFHTDRKLSLLYSQETDEAYIHSFNKLSKYDPIKHELVTIYNFPFSDKLYEWKMPMIKLSNGELWVLRDEVFIFNVKDEHTNTLSYVKQNPFTLSSEYLTSIYETKDGVVWIGTNGMGLNKYSPQMSVFDYYGSFPGAPISLSNNYITSVTSKDDNTVYVATVEGLDIIDIQANTSQHVNLNSGFGLKSRINEILLDDGNYLWLGTSYGLKKWDGKEIIAVTDFKDSLHSDSYINKIYQKAANELIVSTNSAVFLFDVVTNDYKELISLGTREMVFIDDKLWIENSNTILQYDTVNYSLKSELKISKNNLSKIISSDILTFYHDNEGRVWIGTAGGGLALYNPTENKFQVFTQKDGLPNTVVYGILEDEKGNLWLSTNLGITVFNKKLKKSIRSFNTNHGLQGNEFNTKAFYKSASGKMYFGGVNGLTTFYPEQALKLDSEIPKCIITGIYINGARQDEIESGQFSNQIVDEGEMQLSWDERNFGFEISSLGFSYPAYTSYQYLLEGYGKNWSFIENEDRIQYTNIPPGDYILRVKASNSFGEWEPDGLAVAISISPPIWRTTWFILLFLILFILMIYLLLRWRTRLLRIQNERLESTVEERTFKLQQQQEEIAAQNEELIAQSEIMENRNEELERVKNTLEDRVLERTTTLQNVNEELVDQNTKLEQFAFITAHNIRGPVARIKGLISLLEQKDDEVLKLLNSSANDLDQVISDLNLILSIKKGVGNLVEPIALKEQLKLAIKMLKDEMKDVEATIDISNFDEVYIDGLRPYIYSIFYNLIHNALKYSSNERNVLISCSNMLTDDGKLRIIFEDNGIGIDMRYAGNKIFNLYQRFHIEQTGKGFGLYLTKTHVEAMKGTIAVESEVNLGTKFIIEFPISNIPAGGNTIVLE